jgi:hypothetical protein
MVMKDFSALVGEDDDAQAAREAFAAAVEAELNREPALSGDEISPTYHHGPTLFSDGRTACRLPQ